MLSSVPELFVPPRKPVTIEVVVVCDIFFLTSPVRSVSVLCNNLPGLALLWSGLADDFLLVLLFFFSSCGAFRFGFVVCAAFQSEKLPACI